MPKQQALRLGTTVMVVSSVITLFTTWGLIPAFIGWTLLIYAISE
jgi:hypothetical protein